jgi:hypothetical protein
MHAFRKILKVEILLRLFLYVCIHRHKRKAYKNITRTWRSVRAIDNVFLSPVALPGLFCFIFLDDVKSWLWSKEIIFWFPLFFFLFLCWTCVAARSRLLIVIATFSCVVPPYWRIAWDATCWSGRESHPDTLERSSSRKIKHADFYSRRRCRCCCCKRS